MKYFDGVGQVTATTGTGTMTLGAVLDTNFFTLLEQGAADGDKIYYRLDEGGDVEIGIGTIGDTATTLSRDTVLKSRQSDAAGTSKMSLAGAAQVRCVAASDALGKLISADYSQSLTPGEQTQARSNVGGASMLDVRRNRGINPCHQISVENGDASGTASGYYVADNWFLNTNLGGLGRVSASRMTTTTLAGSLKRLQISVDTAEPTLNTSTVFAFFTPFEGSKMADLKFGTSDAIDLVVRLMLNLPEGTWPVRLINAATNRSFIREVVISSGEAGNDVVKVVTFPGDTSGTWSTGDVVWGYLSVALAVGASFQGAADAWSGSNIYGTSACTNGVAAIAATVLQLGDFGLKADPDSTGDYGQFEVPDKEDTAWECRRYARLEGPADTAFGAGVIYAANQVLINHDFSPPMRATPSLTISAASDFRAVAGSFLATASAVTISNATTTQCRLNLVIAGGTVGHGVIMQATTSAASLLFLARL